MARIFLVMLLSFLRRTLYNTWKSHSRQLQVSMRVFNKNFLWIFTISPTQRTHHETTWVCVNNFYWWMPQNLLVLLWFQIIGNTIKALGFHNNNFFRSVKSRCVIQRRIQNHNKDVRWSILQKQLTTFSRSLIAKLQNFQNYKIFQKLYILDIWEHCEYANVICDIIQYLYIEASEKGTHTNTRMKFSLQEFFRWRLCICGDKEGFVEWIPAIKNSAEITFCPKYH